MDKITYTAFRANMADTLDRAERGEIIQIERRGHQPLYLGISPDMRTNQIEHKRRFNESLERVKKRHASVIKELGDK